MYTLLTPSPSTSLVGNPCLDHPPPRFPSAGPASQVPPSPSVRRDGEAEGQGGVWCVIGNKLTSGPPLPLRPKLKVETTKDRYTRNSLSEEKRLGSKEQTLYPYYKE